MWDGAGPESFDVVAGSTQTHPPSMLYPWFGEDTGYVAYIHDYARVDSDIED